MKVTRGMAFKIFDWCKEKYGRNYRGYPYLEFRKPNDLEDDYCIVGSYDDIENLIWVDSQWHKSIIELAKTIIEEYIHYTQNQREYQKLARSHKYANHPFEKQAKKIADRDSKMCINYMKMIYKEFN